MVVIANDDPETKRIAARRARDQERLKKLHNARLRNVGADIAGIQSQIRAKEEAKQREKQVDREYANQQDEIRRYLTHVEAEQELQKRKETEKLRRDWLEQSLKRPERREADLAVTALQVPPIDADECALGAVQKFEGEDVMKAERERLQALQLRSWIEQQKSEKEAAKRQERQEDVQYAQSLSTIVAFQDAQQGEYDKAKALRERQVMNENKRISMARTARLANEKRITKQAEDEELQATISSALLTEDPGQATSTCAGRVRPDHWKGLPKEQIKHIALSNAELIEEKRQRVEAEKNEDVQYAQQQEIYKRIMEQEEYRNLVEQQQRNQLTTQTLEQQVVQAQERERAERRREFDFFAREKSENCQMSAP